jgi:hypothetical protein
MLFCIKQLSQIYQRNDKWKTSVNPPVLIFVISTRSTYKRVWEKYTGPTSVLFYVVLPEFIFIYPFFFILVQAVNIEYYGIANC